MDNNQRCSFTGHRPQKLVHSADEVIRGLEKEILESIASGYTTFITGMACGTDIWAGNIVLRLKETNPSIKLIAAVPFPGFADKWSADWKKKYLDLLNHADLVRTISPSYSEDVFQRRNRWMVDHSSRLIAVYNGTPGGTRNTICYAQSKGIDIRYLEG